MKPLEHSVSETPFQVIDNLFVYAHLHELEAELWEWMKLTVSGTWHKQKPSMRSDILFLYEKMVELVRAAHALNEQRRAKARE
jgi:hypothetical protein